MTEQVVASKPEYDRSRYPSPMGRAISVRLDEEALRALRLIEASGLSRSDAIRSSLVSAATVGRCRRSQR
jgi:predicted DNA-binding protein (UPF0251 family)